MNRMPATGRNTSRRLKKINRMPLPTHHEPMRIEIERPDGDYRFIVAAGAARGATEKDTDPSDQLAHRKRLAQVVVGAELEAEDAVELFVARGEEDDRDGL